MTNEQKENHKKHTKTYYEKNKEKILESVKNYQNDNKEKIKEYKKEYDKKYKESKKEDIKAKNKAYYEATKLKRKLDYEAKKNDIEYQEKLKEQRRINEKKRRQNDPLFKLTKNIRSLINYSLKSKQVKKLTKTELILGCTFDEFKQHLESQFQSWMNWDNYGLYNGTPNYGWDIDHIKPNSKCNENEILLNNHYTNLQPLCSYVNRDVKIDKIA